MDVYSTIIIFFGRVAEGEKFFYAVNHFKCFNQVRMLARILIHDFGRNTAKIWLNGETIVDQLLMKTLFFLRQLRIPNRLSRDSL